MSRTIKNGIMFLSLASLMIGCSNQSSDKKMDSCASGVSIADCSLNIKKLSSWKNEFTMSEPHGDKGTEERTISTYYEFSPSSVNTQWRRTLVIKSSKEGTKSMVQSGTLVGIDQDQITLEINDSSCDQDRIVLAENPQKINIYYKRKGSQLTFSTQPIPPTENSGSDLPIGERLVATVTKAMVHSTQIFLQELFTFGGARSYLETTDIELDQAPALKPENRGELGCFENVGSGFTPFKTQP